MWIIIFMVIYGIPMLPEIQELYRPSDALYEEEHTILSVLSSLIVTAMCLGIAINCAVAAAYELPWYWYMIAPGITVLLCICLDFYRLFVTCRFEHG